MTLTALLAAGALEVPFEVVVALVGLLGSAIVATWQIGRADVKEVRAELTEERKKHEETKKLLTEALASAAELRAAVKYLEKEVADDDERD